MVWKCLNCSTFQKRIRNVEHCQHYESPFKRFQLFELFKMLECWFLLKCCKCSIPRSCGLKLSRMIHIINPHFGNVGHFIILSARSRIQAFSAFQKKAAFQHVSGFTHLTTLKHVDSNCLKYSTFQKWNYKIEHVKHVDSTCLKYGNV